MFELRKGLCIVLTVVLLLGATGCGPKEMSNSEELQILSAIDQRLKSLTVANGIGYGSLADEAANHAAYSLAFDCDITTMPQSNLNELKNQCAKIYESLIPIFESYEMNYFTISFVAVDRKGNELYKNEYIPQ